MSTLIPQHSSATNEHYTPSSVVEPARALLGGFDLDPASCLEANARVQARRIYTIEDDGLAQEWEGLTFLNPPGGKLKRAGDRWVPTKGGKSESSMRVWWAKLVREWLSCRVGEAFFVGFTLEILRLSQHDCLLPVQAFPRCYPKERLAFRGDDPTHANVLVWLPDVHRGPSWRIDADRMRQHFGHLGHCEGGHR